MPMVVLNLKMVTHQENKKFDGATFDEVVIKIKAFLDEL